MFESLQFLESARSKLEILAAALTITAALLILLTRWPIARRISFLQSKEKAELQLKLNSSVESTSRLREELAEANRQHQATERDLRQQLEVTSNQSREASDRARQLAEEASPRHLTTAQVAKLKEQLSPCSGQKVAFEVPIGAPECLAYAQQVAAAFTQAGWHVTDTIQAVYTGTPQGVRIRVASQNTPHPCALRVQQAFSSIGEEAPGEIDPGESPELLRIIIGVKVLKGKVG